MSGDIEFRPNVNFQYYPPEYFSGCDIHILLDSEWVSEISAFQYAVAVNAMPIYGYADKKPRKIVSGTRLIVGNFVVNRRGAYNLLQMLTRDSAAESKQESIPQPAPFPAIASMVGLMVVEAMSRSQLAETNDLLRKAYWGKAEEDTLSMKKQTLLGQSSFDDVIDKEFANLNIVYGNIDDFNNINMEELSTTNDYTTISDITINNISEAVDMSGRPVGINYSFMAKSIDYQMMTM